MTTHPMIERIAKAIAEPRSRYIVRCCVMSYDGKGLATSYEWQVWLFDTKSGCEDLVVSGNDHAIAEEIKEKLDLELLARLAVEAMLEPTIDMIGAAWHTEETSKIWKAMLNVVLKNE